MTTLRSGGSVARVVAEEGAVVESFVVDGVSVLARTDRTGTDPAPHDAPADEDEWVRAWRGGWQLCLPSSGRAGDADPFHGRASQTAWRVDSSEASAVVLSWEGDGLRARREWRLDDGELTARTTVENAGPHPVPFAPAEHLVLGDAMLRATPDASAARAETAPACVAEVATDPRTLIGALDDAGVPEGDPIAWPGVRDDPWTTVLEGRARMAVLTPPGGRAVVAVRGEAAVAEVRWDTAELPHAVLWQEVGATRTPPWDGRVRALGVEPTASPHGAGPVAGGIAELMPGAVARWTCTLAIRRGVPA